MPHLSLATCHADMRFHTAQPHCLPGSQGGQHQLGDSVGHIAWYTECPCAFVFPTLDGYSTQGFMVHGAGAMRNGDFVPWDGDVDVMIAVSHAFFVVVNFVPRLQSVTNDTANAALFLNASKTRYRT